MQQRKQKTIRVYQITITAFKWKKKKAWKKLVFPTSIEAILDEPIRLFPDDEDSAYLVLPQGSILFRGELGEPWEVEPKPLRVLDQEEFGGGICEYNCKYVGYDVLFLGHDID